ncbi:hypothetical protein GR925_29825 [Streptomyces sp. HUCO-GS316]|uniref:hypothetical protein n=1 Tax=Streptomyces sp. HUCO-GS316 TaxID=2692198 RepID=UPI001371E048|nr:hypothetical protein [Streptomyces sp. HUCO-GS316]MXM67520.1 hypothetical protein [Streptomyces sp. HUCO-GS316]
MTEQPRATDETPEPEPQLTSPVVVEQPQTVLPPPPEAPPSASAPAAPRDRRVLRAALRWTAAVVVFAAVGTATAYGITRMERTDVPGLATESDGRWDFPTLTRPPLPSGSPAPFAESNPAGAHHADLRALLLPAPEGATQDTALNGTDGWLETKDYLAEYAVKEERDELGQRLVDHGLRHIAARGWTTQDGTRTRVYLLQFGTAEIAETLYGSVVSYDTPVYAVRGADASSFDETLTLGSRVSHVERSVQVESKPYGAEQVRHAYLAAGDVVAVIVQSRKGTAPAVPFHQTVTLQSQLLG